MLHDVGVMLHHALLDQALDELGVRHPDAAALAVDDVLLLDDDGLDAVVRQSGGGCAG